MNKEQIEKQIEEIKDLFIEKTGWEWKSEVWFNFGWCSCIKYKNVTVYYDDISKTYAGYISIDEMEGHSPVFGKLPVATTPKKLISKIKVQVKILSKRIQEIENNLK